MRVELLKEYARLVQEAKELTAEREELRRGLVCRGGGVSPEDSGSIGRIVVQVEELDECLAGLVGQIQQRRQKLEKALGVLPSLERQALRLHYINGLPWRQVAARLNYSESQIRRIGRRAKKKLDTGKDRRL